MSGDPCVYPSPTLRYLIKPHYRWDLRSPHPPPSLYKQENPDGGRVWHAQSHTENWWRILIPKRRALAQPFRPIPMYPAKSGIAQSLKSHLATWDVSYTTVMPFWPSHSPFGNKPPGNNLKKDTGRKKSHLTKMLMPTLFERLDMWLPPEHPTTGEESGSHFNLLSLLKVMALDTGTIKCLHETLLGGKCTNRF